MIWLLLYSWHLLLKKLTHCIKKNETLTSGKNSTTEHKVKLSVSILRKALLQMREKELCGNYNVVKIEKITAETVGGAELSQDQMQLVQTERHMGKKDV